MSTPTIAVSARPAGHPEDLDALRQMITGTLAEPGDAQYALATPWNVAVPRRPRAVVAVADAQDVVRTVRFAAEHGLRVAVQRTGHGALALEGSDVLLIHTGRLDACTIDVEGRTASVGAGAIWQDVLDAATPHRLAPPVGSAPGVGVVGYLTGGGIGPLVRTIGPSSDLVRAFEVVTGQGDLVRATPHQHADLFWGLRGGKGSLGIVTGVEFALLEIAELHAGALYFDGVDAAAVAHAWQVWCQDLPEHTSTSLALLQLPAAPGVPEPLAGRATVAVRVASLASEAEASAIVAPLRACVTPLIDTIGTMPYAAIAGVHADPIDPMPTHEATALLSELTGEAVDALLAVAGPGASSPQAMVELRLLGGAFARPAQHPSALCHRDAAFTVLTVGVLVPPIAEAVAPHAASVMQALAPWSTGGALPNFGPSADQAGTARCYDEETLRWLGALADQYDPAGVLRVGHVVRATQAPAC